MAVWTGGHGQTQNANIGKLLEDMIKNMIVFELLYPGPLFFLQISEKLTFVCILL